LEGNRATDSVDRTPRSERVRATVSTLTFGRAAMFGVVLGAPGHATAVHGVVQVIRQHMRRLQVQQIDRLKVIAEHDVQ